jgi:hypothetical protein
MNRYDEAEATALKAKIPDVVKALKSNEIPFLEGVRKLVAYGSEFTSEYHDPDFVFFIAVDSETDHFPAEKVRQYCSARFLKKCAEELSGYKTRCSADLMEACDVLIQRFAKA